MPIKWIDFKAIHFLGKYNVDSVLSKIQNRLASKESMKDNVSDFSGNKSFSSFSHVAAVKLVFDI